MVTFRKAYEYVLSALETAGIENSRNESMWLFEHFFGRDFRMMTDTERDTTADEEKSTEFISAVKKRTEGEPLQYLLGEWEFYGYPFLVGEGVLIPRQDTETIIEVVKSLEIPTPKIVDLCSGSGCIAITLSKETDAARITAVEKYDGAMKYLERNVKLNNSDIAVVRGDVLDADTVSAVGGCDIIVCNPPYLTQRDMEELQDEVKREPETALFGGNDGLDFYRKITALWKDSLSDGGYMVYEIGAGQENDVAQIFRENGFDDIEFTQDLCKIIRVVSARKK